MSIESSQINHSNPLSTDAITQDKGQKATQNGGNANLNNKIKEAIPGEIAHPQEHPEEPVPTLNFQAKILNPGSEGTLPNTLVETVLLNQESNENNHLPNLAADVMAHSIQSGQVASKLSAEEEILADINFDELSPDEIEAMLQKMANQEAQINQKREVKVAAYSTEENELNRALIDESTEKEVYQTKIDERESNNQLTKSIDSELTAAEMQELADSDKFRAENRIEMGNGNEVIPAENTKDTLAAHKADFEEKMAAIDKQIGIAKTALKADPTNHKIQAHLANLVTAKKDIQMKLDSGMSHEEVMKSTFIGGRSLHEMTVNDLHEVLHNLHTGSLGESRDKEINEDASKAGERGRADRSARDDKTARDKAEAGKKEELLKAHDGQDRIVTELQYQQMRSRIEKDKEKLEESLQKILSSIVEDRRMKEIETTEIKKDAASDALVSHGNKQKAINATQKMIDEVGTPLKMPVKKETLRMVVAVIRQIDSLPAGKSDPQIRDLQKTLIGFYQDIRQAVGVEVLGGTGTAHRVHTNQS